MPDWKNVLTHFTANAENLMDALRYRLYYALGGPGPVKIITYRGYGTPERLFLRGRVLKDKNIAEAQENDDLWENLLNTYKRMSSTEIPFAHLAARFQGQERELTANEEGFFEVWIEPQRPLAGDRLWHPIELELLDPIPEEQSRYPIKAVGQVLVPPNTARYMVISDIDDTVLQSDATHLLRMARNVFLGNAHTRLPFPGVAALYRAMFSGVSGSEMNPLFYVSSSPWNLYDLLSHFFNLQGIPVGPVLHLRDWGVNENEILPLMHRNYKIDTIRKIIDFFPYLPFVLIGDSGQEDPEIYAELVREYPNRALAVYIRNVSRDLKRPEEVRKLAQRVIEEGGSLVLAEDSETIARHAIELELINPQSLEAVREDRRKDEAPLTAAERVLGGEEEAGEAEQAAVKEREAAEKAPTVKLEGKQPGTQPDETKQAVKDGAVEDAVKSAGAEKTENPPPVVVEGQKRKKPKK